MTSHKLDIDNPDGVIRAAGNFHTAHTGTAGAAGTVFDELVPHTRPGSQLDRALVERSKWIRSTGITAIKETGTQSQTTVDVTRVAATALENANIDSGRTVRDASV